MSVPDEVRVALGRGCLAGLGLAVIFVLVSGLLYLAARSFGLEQGLALVIGIAGGPVVVSAIVLGGVALRAGGRARHADLQLADENHATTTRDES